MKTEKIHAIIKTYIKHNSLNPSNLSVLSDDDSFFENGIIDSVGVLELVAFLEETFNMTIDDHELTLENLDSVNRLMSFIQSKIKNGP
ncbi:MAG: acyl carrier protein [Desulfatirhabdiaceae bacterium]